MNPHLKRLKIKKMIKELEYLSLDLIWKNELLSQTSSKFEESVESFLNKNPKLKEVINDDVPELNLDDIVLDFPQNQIREVKDQKIKNIWKEISKITHPDKSKNIIMTDIYLEAKKAYENNDFFELIIICNKLNINYELNPEETEQLSEEIEETKKKIEFIESTFIWKWLNNNKNKDLIILDYIRKELNLN